jgi:uncharacterized protein
MEAAQFVKALDMQAHPEGGFFKETYRSDGTMSEACLPPGMKGRRSYSTSIYYLLRQGEFSAFHRIRSDEGWHFYEGGPLLVHMINPNGHYSSVRLGRNLDDGEVFQFVVPAGTWFASEPGNGSAFSLVGCTVSPGFDFADFELAGYDQLSSQFPQHATIIRRLCH